MPVTFVFGVPSEHRQLSIVDKCCGQEMDLGRVGQVYKQKNLLKLQQVS